MALSLPLQHLKQIAAHEVVVARVAVEIREAVGVQIVIFPSLEANTCISPYTRKTKTQWR